ncbi:MAG: tRNA pseudouridine(54/55) synthase Pus10 [Thermoplasmatota archaeon]
MNQLTLESDTVLKAARSLAARPLCNACLGRQFAQVEHGHTNRERGEQLRETLELAPVQPEECWLCDGLMDDISLFADLVMEQLAPYQYDTFLVGSRIAEDVERREAQLAQAAGHGEPMKREVNREVGKIVEEQTGKAVAFQKPDVTAIIDTRFDHVELDVRPLFIRGRYRKLERGIPQTKWYCRKCHGAGCDYCNGQGKLYETSVEELVAREAMAATQGADEAFHGAGREDIDVRMLGTGRPFILEVKEPRRRHLDLEQLERDINASADGRVEVSDLRMASRDEIAAIKEASWSKTYRAVIATAERGKINEAVSALRGTYINQRTPSRVAHRRADRVRKRKILDMAVEQQDAHEATLLIKAESGTYIKELLTGDNGRTRPSLSELADTAVDVKKLDVIGIGDTNGEKIQGNKK